MKKIFILFLLFSFEGTCCEVTLPTMILKDFSVDINSLSKDCSNEKIDQLKNEIKKREGNISNEFLSELTQIKIKPQSNLNVSNLLKLIREKINLKENETLKFIQKPQVSLTTLSTLRKISIQCIACTENKERYVLSVEFHSQRKKERIEMKVEKNYKTIVFQAKEKIQHNNDFLSKSLFKKVEIETPSPEKYLKSLEQISYMKTSINIKEGDILKQNSLKFKKIIKRGELVKVFIKKKNLNISLHAKALENGQFNQKINLTSKNKDIQARVIGPGMAEVML